MVNILLEGYEINSDYLYDDLKKYILTDYSVAVIAFSFRDSEVKNSTEWNLLYSKEKGIDFDLTEVNVRIFDICYCATAMLSECFSKPNVDINKWLEIFDNLVAGYDSINKLSDSEKQAMPYVIYSIQIICISYFSQYDKYIDLTDINTKMLKWLLENL